MSLETDLLLDRRRLKRRLLLWRLLAAAAVLVAAILAAPLAGLPRPGAAHVARVTISGIITEDRDLVGDIADLADDPSAKALELVIDSPGGSVASGEALHDAIARVAAVKPVVAIMGGTAASAGYMIAVPAQRILARGGTLTGSIGVMLEAPELSGLLAKLGIASDTLVSGPLKDQPSLTHPLSAEGRAVLQGLVADLYDQFVTMVATGRHMSPAAVRALADGRAYTGRQALALGLVDQIGGEKEARAWLAEAKGVRASLPVRDLASSSLVSRTLGAGGRQILHVLAKTVLLQSLTLDGAWSLWHPAGS